MLEKLELYQNKYKFNIIEPFFPLDEISQMEDLVKFDPFKKRRKYYNKILRRYRILNLVGAAQIELPIRYLYNSYCYEVFDPNLYIGSPFKKLAYCRCKEGTRNDYNNFNSLYVGELPLSVVKKINIARNLDGLRDLIIVSRDSRLFDIETVRIPKISPLLIAFMKNEQKYLLAVWGIEHELPQSLGGILPNTMEKVIDE